ncbi:hypothetical protein [Dethiosulfatarculus sandiegensis]|uniref:Uncharacterized protein n=1 Tax=Dethiosulfatarculus sandiegensis TaxID=1429043 RepID=A0A0D2HVR2_9BACT|nr:hypothetical protein [Dethiosulfatarculus sandiegensis]KIX14473.1 hypothetical protein X474_10375 [Dethiosulfatarculus sandiegensis]
MEVSSTQASDYVYNVSRGRMAVGAGEKGSAQGVMTQDTVQISDEARALIQKSHEEAMTRAESDPQEEEETILPVEAYSLPGWYADLCSELNMVDTQIGGYYSETRQAAYDALSNQGKKDLAEYNSTLHKYFSQELKNHGIKDASDYYREIVQNQNGVSDQMEQAVKQRLADNPRAMKLMAYFGLSLEA